MSKTLYLHIGHNKTGSSYLQSLFANNRTRLAEYQINYPTDDHDQDAINGLISTGNGKTFSRIIKHEKGIPPFEHLFISSEILLGNLSKNEDYKSRLRHFLKTQRIEFLKVLLFIRDPVAHASSLYQQQIKRGGLDCDIDEFFLSHYETPVDVSNLINFLDSIKISSLTIENYSASRYSISAISERWLGIPIGTLLPIDKDTVNRSLTWSELVLLRSLNKLIGKSGKLLSDQLCNELPRVKGDLILPAVATQEMLWNKLSSHIVFINSRVALGARYEKSRDIRPPTPHPAKFEFSAEQLLVIANCIAAQEKRARLLKNKILKARKLPSLKS